MQDILPVLVRNALVKKSHLWPGVSTFYPLFSQVSQRGAWERLWPGFYSPDHNEPEPQQEHQPVALHRERTEEKETEQVLQLRRH